jgi:hypothetical protein
MTENGVPLRLKIIVAGRADLALSFATGATSTQLLLISHSAYLRATKAFWQAHLGARGAALANRWIEVPPTSTGAITASLGPFAPTTLARCLVEDHGTLSIAGRTTIAGRPATLVRDAGDAPGAAPGTLAVAAAGTPYPLQFRATGPQRPGGPIDVCNDGKGSDTRGTATFSHFGSVPPLRPPSRSVRLHPSASA